MSKLGYGIALSFLGGALIFAGVAVVGTQTNKGAIVGTVCRKTADLDDNGVHMIKVRDAAGKTTSLHAEDNYYNVITPGKVYTISWDGLVTQRVTGVTPKSDVTVRCPE